DDIPIHEFTQTENLHWEYEVLGVTTGPHPMALCRGWLEQQGMVTSAALKTLPDKTQVKTAGLVVVHQAPPTANGFHFLTLEDEGGLLDLIVSPTIYEQYSPVLRQSAILMVVGVVQQEADVTNILVQHAAKLPTVKK
ncbi:partial Error-prone DNA polymerase, partial [Anaerolineae bacterium]